MPQLLLQEADRTWRRTKREESRHSLTDFEMDVKRILSTMLEIKPVDTKVCFHDCTDNENGNMTISLDGIVRLPNTTRRFFDVGNHK